MLHTATYRIKINVASYDSDDDIIAGVTSVLGLLHKNKAGIMDGKDIKCVNYLMSLMDGTRAVSS